MRFSAMLLLSSLLLISTTRCAKENLLGVRKSVTPDETGSQGELSSERESSHRFENPQNTSIKTGQKENLERVLAVQYQAKIDLLKIAPDGSILAALINGALNLIDPDTLTITKTFNEMKKIDYIEFSPDSRKIVALDLADNAVPAESTSLAVFDLTQERMLWQNKHVWITRSGIHFSRDSSKFIVINDGIITVVDTTAGSLTTPVASRLYGDFAFYNFDETLLYVLVDGGDGENSKLITYDLASQSVLRTLPLMGRFYYRYARWDIDKDRRFLAFSAYDQPNTLLDGLRFCVIDLVSGRQASIAANEKQNDPWVMYIGGKATSVSLFGSPTKLAVGTESNLVRVFRLEPMSSPDYRPVELYRFYQDENPLIDSKIEESSFGQVDALDVSDKEDNYFAFTSSTRPPNSPMSPHWELKKLKKANAHSMTKIFRHSESPHQKFPLFDITPDEATVASRSAVFDLSTEKEVYAAAHDQIIYGFASNASILTGSASGLEVFDFLSHQSKCSFQNTQNTSFAKVTADRSKVIYTTPNAGASGCIYRIFSLNNCSLIHELEVDAGGIRAGQICRSAEIVGGNVETLAVPAKQSVRLINLTNGTVEKELTTPLWDDYQTPTGILKYYISSSPNSPFIAITRKLVHLGDRSPDDNNMHSRVFNANTGVVEDIGSTDISWEHNGQRVILSDEGFNVRLMPSGDRVAISSGLYDGNTRVYNLTTKKYEDSAYVDDPRAFYRCTYTDSEHCNGLIYKFSTKNALLIGDQLMHVTIWQHQ